MKNEKTEAPLALTPLKGNMHHKYDISLKDAFFIIYLTAEIFFEKFES